VIEISKNLEGPNGMGEPAYAILEQEQTLKPDLIVG